MIKKRDPRQSRVGFALENALENVLEPLFSLPSARRPTSPPPPLELTFRSSRLFLGKPLAVCITLFLPPLAVQPLHYCLSPSSALRVPCKPASLELAAAFGPSFLPPEAFDRPPLELTFCSSRLFLGKPLAVCITLSRDETREGNLLAGI